MPISPRADERRDADSPQLPDATTKRPCPRPARRGSRDAGGGQTSRTTTARRSAAARRRPGAPAADPRAAPASRRHERSSARRPSSRSGRTTAVRGGFRGRRRPAAAERQRQRHRRRRPALRPRPRCAAVRAVSTGRRRVAATSSATAARASAARYKPFHRLSDCSRLLLCHLSQARPASSSASPTNDRSPGRSRRRGRGGRARRADVQGERLEENVRDLAAGLTDPLVLPLDVTDDAQIARVFEEIDRDVRRTGLRGPRRRVRAPRGAVESLRADDARRVQASRSTSAPIR